MIASIELQRAIFAALNGQIIGAVLDEFPVTGQKISGPYTVIGEVAAETPWDTHDTDGSEEEPLIHTWSEARGSTEVKTIMAQIDARLHHVPLALDGGKALVMIKREFMTVLREVEDDGKVWRHGVMRYRALITE